MRLCVLIRSLMQDALWHYGLIHGGLEAKILEWVAISTPGYLPDPVSNVISCIAGRLVPRRTRNLEEAHFSVPLSCHHHMQWFFTVTLTVFLVAAACAALQMLYTPGPPSMLCQRDSSMSGAPTLPHRLESQHHRRVNEKRGIFSPYFPQFQCARILVTGAQLQVCKTEN